MLYETDSKAYQKFVNTPGQCSVCYVPFCSDCSCTQSSSELPCSCKTNICIGCFAGMIKNLRPEEYCCCGCGAAIVKCPTCRFEYSVQNDMVEFYANLDLNKVMK